MCISKLIFLLESLVEWERCWSKQETLKSSVQPCWEEDLLCIHAYVDSQRCPCLHIALTACMLTSACRLVGSSLCIQPRSFFCESMAGKERAKNTASPKEVAKLMRGANLTKLPPESEYMIADTSKVIETFEDFLKDLLLATPRPTEKLLLQACKLVFEHTSKSDCKSFAQQLVRCVQHVRECKSVTSGKKTPEAVWRVLQVMKANKEQPCRRLSTTSASSAASPSAVDSKPSPEPMVEKVSLASKAELSPGSKVRHAYGLAASRTMQKEEDGEDLLEVVAVQSSQSLHSIASSGEEVSPEKEGEMEDVPPAADFKDYFDAGRGCHVRAFASGKLEELTAPVSRVTGKKVLKAALKTKPAAGQVKKKPAGAETAEVPKSSEVDVQAAQLAEAKQQEETILHFVRKSTAKKPPRTYVTACYCDGSKHRQKLIVEFQAAKYADHVEKAAKAVKRIQKDKLTFNRARQLKFALAED